MEQAVPIRPHDHDHDYDHSRPFDVWKAGEAPQIGEAVSYLFEELKPHFGHNINKKPGRYKQAIKKVVLDLYVAWLSDPHLFVAYSRNRNDYSMGRRYSKLHINYNAMIDVIDILHELGYIHHKTGFHDRSRGIGRQSRMIATPKLIRLIESKRINKHMIHHQREEIELRNSAKKPIDYIDTSKTIRWRLNVQQINGVLLGADISMELTSPEKEELVKRIGYLPDDTNKTLFRVFNNGSFKQGGRFYGHWIQNIPREYRKRLRMDGEETVELDFAGVHINILYRLAGQAIPRDDVYALDGFAPAIRPFLKRALLIMVNAKDRGQAVRAIQAEPITGELRFKRGDIERAMDGFIQRHRPIERFFNSGIGLDLQFADSRIAEHVMLELAGCNIVCVPLGDGFICKVAFENELREAMQAAFRDMFGVSIGIDREY